jgi:hypothetical protein
MKVRRILFAIVAVHLLMCIRFFHKYVDAAPWLLHTAYAATALLALLVVLHSRFLFGLFTTTWTLVMAFAGLFLLVLVAYPRADALREVGRGSDQDDCVRTLVHNVFDLRNPFGFGYFGDPCSTGPSEFFIYWPVQVSTGFFILAPVLWTAVGYWVLSQVTDQAVTVLLTLSLFSSWLFLEMSSVGSDMIAIAWLFAAGTVACEQGIRRERPALLLVGAFAYVMFAGSRVPLLVVTPGLCWCSSWRPAVAPFLWRRRFYSPPRRCTSAALRSPQTPSHPGTWSGSHSASLVSSAAAFR